MYLPGSYLVYPTPIHLHPFPPPGAASTVQPVRPAGGGGDPAGLSPPPSVQSRDLKFGVERILSGEVSSCSSSRSAAGRPTLKSPPEEGVAGCRGSPPGDGAPSSPGMRSEGSSQHSGATTPRPDTGGSPPTPLRPFSSPSSTFPPSPPAPPTLPTLVVPRGLLACPHPGGGGESPFPHPFHPSTFASPPASPFPRPLASDPLGPATAAAALASSAAGPGGHRTAPGAPHSPYAAAAYAAAAGFYPHHLHHHHHHQHPAAMLPYAPLYPQGAMLGGHLEDASAAAGTLGGATCIPVSSSGGSSGGGVVGGGAGGGGKRKRSWSRAVFSNLQRKGLEKRFQLQKYITKPDRRQLAATLGLTDAQVKVWFQNRRMKWRHSKEGKQQMVEPSASSIASSLPPPPPSASSLHLISAHDEGKSDQSPSTMPEPAAFSPEWENQESRSTDRPDSTQKGLEEEIQVDS